MATQFAVDLVFKSQGDNKIKDATDKLKGLEGAAKSAEKSTSGAANGVRAFGRSAAGASGGVRVLGTAIQAALGPLALLGGAVGALTAAFQTLSTQDFAEAKVRSLGTSSVDLVKELKQVSKELNGQASVVELTSAAYDVASAGFVKAADAAKVLKAASLGATGGFSDINTVGNAATSVLNAYGLSADHAGSLVDKFIQTQNDGKVIVAEYAANIGKVAAAAAGLGIPLEQVNAVIAQSTASGVNAEVAFTGLKAALARLASGEASDALKGTGLSIDAATLKTDGLIGTFKKLKAAGLDTGQIFKALGTEAGPALLPVLNNLERYEELLEKQKNSAGAAAAAQKQAADTIQGAWKSVQTELENFFSDQSALGELLKVTLKGLAFVVKTTAETFNFMLAPLKEILGVLGQLAGAIDKAFNISESVQRATSAVDAFKGELGTIKDEFLVELAEAFQPVVDKWNEGMGVIREVWSDAMQELGQLATGFGEWVAGVWNGIASGAQGVIAPIQNAFSAAFQGAMQIVQNFWNSLPNWLKSALSAASSVAGAVFGAVGNALNKIKGAAGNALKGGKSTPGSGPGGGGAPQSFTGGSTGGSTGGGGGGGKGGGGAVSQLPQLQGELALKQKLFELDKQIQAAQLAGNKVLEQQLERKKIEAELDGKIAKIGLEKLTSQERGTKVEIARLEAAEKLADLDFKAAKAAKDRADKVSDILGDLDRQIQLEGAGSEEARRQLEIEFKIADYKKQGLDLTESEIEAIRRKNAELDQTKAKADEIKSQQAMLQSLYDGIGSSIANGIGSAIDAVASGTEDLGKTLEDLGRQILAQVGKMLIFYALAQAFGAMAGGAGASGNGLLGAIAKGFGFQFGGGKASGGPVTAGQSYLVGENGPEILNMSPDGSGGYVYNSGQSKAMARWNSGNSSGGGGGGGGTEGEAGINPTINISTGNTLNFEGKNYVSRDDFQIGLAQAAKQGAKAGEANTLRRLQMNPAARRRIGI